MDAIDQAIKVLNEALELDASAVRRLFWFETPVNLRLADHPTIQVGASQAQAPQNPMPHLRVLGLINGLFGVDEHDWGFIAMEVDDNDHYMIRRFFRVNHGGKPVEENEDGDTARVSGTELRMDGTDAGNRQSPGLPR